MPKDLLQTLFQELQIAPPGSVGGSRLTGRQALRVLEHFVDTRCYDDGAKGSPGSLLCSEVKNLSLSATTWEDIDLDDSGSLQRLTTRPDFVHVVLIPLCVLVIGAGGGRASGSTKSLLLRLLALLDVFPVCLPMASCLFVPLRVQTSAHSGRGVYVERTFSVDQSWPSLPLTGLSLPVSAALLLKGDFDASTVDAWERARPEQYALRLDSARAAEQSSNQVREVMKQVGALLGSRTGRDWCLAVALQDFDSDPPQGPLQPEHRVGRQRVTGRY